MKDAHEEMRNRIKALTDEELLNMIDADPQDYTEESLMIAKQEAGSRGGIEVLHKNIGIKNEHSEEQPEPIAGLGLQKSQAGSAESNLASRETRSSKSRTIKEESIQLEWAMMIDHGAGNARVMYDDIRRRLRESQIPGECSWSLDEVKSSDWLSRVRREFLVVDIRQFKDYHIYVGVRDYGIHLDCCYYVTIEPGLLKKLASKKIYNDNRAMSVPRNMLVHQDLRAWITVVDHAVNKAADVVLNKLGQDPKSVHRGSKGFLEIW